ncbi:MAG: ABC transporter ATP-binding protein, partial [Pseudonocardiaceae bacterium]
GSGKSVSMLTVMGLTRGRNTTIGGAARFEGRDLLTVPGEELRHVRGNDVAMIFQDPLSSLHPFFKVGSQLVEAMQAHRDVSKAAARDRAVALLGMVGIPDPRTRLDAYPHESSGGMRQRAMIAMALANDPKLLIADEPTTALDVTVQAQILDLMRRLQQELDMAVILITHDLGVVAEVADRIAVMYAGRIVENADVGSLYAKPCHPYTLALLESIPRVDSKGTELTVIKGLPPNLTAIPPGCPFHPRCPMAVDRCHQVVPPLEPLPDDRSSACLFAKELVSR